MACMQHASTTICVAGQRIIGQCYAKLVSEAAHAVARRPLAQNIACEDASRVQPCLSLAQSGPSQVIQGGCLSKTTEGHKSPRTMNCSEQPPDWSETLLLRLHVLPQQVTYSETASTDR